jgi:D-glycero-D-manno-heptose 1,7-bisphosphate phosphatase
MPVDLIAGSALRSKLPLWDLERAAPARRPGVFLDLEGTLVEPMDDCADPARLRIMPGAGAALARLQRAGLALVVVTDQSGLAQGRFTRSEFARLQTSLLQRLSDDAGVALEDVAVCPHAPDAQGRPACLCRKPAPGMLLRMAHRHAIDLAASWMVGDTLDDVEAGHRAGAGGLLLDCGGETVWRRSPMREPDAVLADWPALAAHVETMQRARDAVTAASTLS